MPNLKLTYFDVPGKAEVTRLALYIGDIPFEDERLDREAFQSRAKSFPFQAVPVLTVDGVMFAQSFAIARYAGILSGHYPANDALAGLQVDEIYLLSEDVWAEAMPSLFEKDAEKKKAMRETLSNETLPWYFNVLEKRLEDVMKGDFLLGDEPTIADLSVYSMVSWIASGSLDYVPTNLCEGYPKMMAIYNGISNHPKVKEWYAKK
jgi:glutathione S-transferase